jgi:hypothetical protein
VRRLAVIVVTFALALGAVSLLAFGRLGEAARGAVLEQGGAAATLETVAGAALMPSRRARNRPLAVWLGDSTIDPISQFAYPEMIRRRTRRHMSHEIVATFGFDFFDYYALLSLTLRADPELVVLIANPRLFETHAMDARFRLLSALIPVAELPRTLLLPLSARGLTVPRLLLNRALRDPGVRSRYWACEGLRVLFQEAEFWRGLGPRWMGWERAFEAERALFDYAAPVGRRSAVVRMMSATTELARRRGAEVLVIVCPIPYELMIRRGLYDERDYRRRMEVLRAAVVDVGGRFLDLHRELREAEFRDPFGHYTVGGSTHLARVVQPHVLRAAGLPAGPRRRRR